MLGVSELVKSVEDNWLFAKKNNLLGILLIVLGFILHILGIII